MVTKEKKVVGREKLGVWNYTLNKTDNQQGPTAYCIAQGTIFIIL